jgi:hypothetical protein
MVNAEAQPAISTAILTSKALFFRVATHNVAIALCKLYAELGLTQGQLERRGCAQLIAASIAKLVY